MTGTDEWKAECYERVWLIDTPGVAATAAQLPVIEIDLRGVKYIRVRAREIGDTTNRGTFSGSVVLSRIYR